jgi:hypothetical protein
LNLTSQDQVKISHAAFQKNIADSTAKSLTDINLQVEGNNFPAAMKKLEELHASNGIGGREYEAQKSLIQTSEQSHLIDVEIAKDPLAVKRIAEDAIQKDEQLQGFPNIGKDQLPKIATKAQKVFDVQQDRNYGDISSDISAGNIKSVVDLEKDARFSKVADGKNREALKESITDKWLYTKEGESFNKVAMNTVKAYPQTDDPATEAMQIRKYANENVPSIFRDAINKELDSKINEMASNGGKLKPETELIQYGTQRLSVARDGGVFGKFYSDKEVKDDSSGKKAKANIDAMKQMEDVELTLRNSGAKTRAEADKVIEEATAAGRAKQAAGEIGNQKGWFDFLNSKKAEAVKPPSWLNEPKASNWQPNANDTRADGTQKGTGFLGVLKRPDGRVSTEISIGVNINGKEMDIPTLVPTLSKDEVNYLLSTPEDRIMEADKGMYRSIEQKAVDHAKSRMQKGESPFAGSKAQGKITKYGYEKPGDKDYDTNSARGIGAADNQLVPGESVALSPDLEKSTGAKIGDKVVVTLSNGEKMVKRFDDRTSKRLKGRVDIYSPDGNQPLDGVKVAKVEKYTEDGSKG